MENPGHIFLNISILGQNEVSHILDSYIWTFEQNNCSYVQIFQ